MYFCDYIKPIIVTLQIYCFFQSKPKHADKSVGSNEFVIVFKKEKEGSECFLLYF